MSSGANLRGFDEVMRNIEAKLGDARVNRVVNKALRETAEELEPDFQRALGVYADTGATVRSTAVSGVKGGGLGAPNVHLGFTSPRWQLVHLNEMGYAKKRNPRGFGVIRRFGEMSRYKYQGTLMKKLKVLAR